MGAVNTNIKPGEMDDVRAWMRDQFPPEDCARNWPANTEVEIYKFMRVDMKPGDNIKAHKHAHHALLYYPQAADAIIVTPQPGTFIYMPPGTLHEVPVVKKARQSFAMLTAPI